MCCDCPTASYHRKHTEPLTYRQFIHMRSALRMDLETSKSKRMPKSKSMLFFSGPPVEHKFLHPSKEEARNSMEEVEQKAKVNFPKLFQRRELEITDAYSEQSSTRSLLSSDVPYQIQHALLVTTQNILEQCCYAFARKWFPFEVEATGCNCAEAVELTKWTRLILKHSKSLPPEALAVEGSSSLQEILASVQLLRHTAVHRLRTTARGVLKLIRDSVTFAEALRDSRWISKLRNLLRQAETELDKANNEYALDGGITAILHNQLHGVVPRFDGCNLNEELVALFEMLPTTYYEQDANEVMDSVVNGCVVATKKRSNVYRKAKTIQFERSRAPSPESMTGKCSKQIPAGDEPANLSSIVEASSTKEQ